MDLSPGKYAITNVLRSYFACLPTSNREQHLVRIIDPDSKNHSGGLTNRGIPYRGALFIYSSL